MKLFANRFTEISKCAACVFAVTISFTMPMFAQNTNPSPLVPLAISASSTQDEWNAARLRGDEPAGFSNQKTSKPYVWDAQWLTLYERDKNGLCKRQGREYAQTAFPMVSEQDVGIKQYLHANGGKSPYPESLFKGLGDKVDAREQGRIRQAEYRFPRLVGKVYAWNAEGKLLGTTVLNQIGRAHV